MAEDTELVNIGGLFRNTSKKGDVYYSGKSEDGDQYVLFRNAYWKEGAEPAKPYFRLMKRVPKGSAPSAMNDQIKWSLTTGQNLAKAREFGYQTQ